MRVTLIGGGIGCARLAVPLADAVGPDRLTAVVNTGDDLWRYGLRICPDLDTNLYALSGLRDAERGWGIAGDTFAAMQQLRRLGDDPWFNLGDLDLATHLLRTSMLREGASLGEVTAHLTAMLDVTATLLPTTNDEICTRVSTPTGEWSFQEYFVWRRAEDDVDEVTYDGAAAARPAPGVLGAIADAELVVIGPSNPVASIGPILAVAGIREVLTARHERGRPTVAVTPVVSGVPIVDPGEAHRARCRASMMASRGLPHRASAVAAMLGGLADTFVLDGADRAEADAVAAAGHRVVVADTIVADGRRGAALAEVVLAAAEG